MTAYLVAHFRIIRGQPFFQGTCIYSEPGCSVEGATGPCKWAVTVMEAYGDTYQEARDNLLSIGNSVFGRCFRWAFDALKER